MIARISKTNGLNDMQDRVVKGGEMPRSTRCHVAVAVLAMMSPTVWAQLPVAGSGGAHGLHASVAQLPGSAAASPGPSVAPGTEEAPQSTLYGLSHAEKRELRRQILDAGRELYVRPVSDPTLLMPAAELP